MRGKIESTRILTCYGRIDWIYPACSSLHHIYYFIFQHSIGVLLSVKVDSGPEPVLHVAAPHSFNTQRTPLLIFFVASFTSMAFEQWPSLYISIILVSYLNLLTAAPAWPPPPTLSRPAPLSNRVSKWNWQWQSSDMPKTTAQDPRCDLPISATLAAAQPNLFENLGKQGGNEIFEINPASTVASGRLALDCINNRCHKLRSLWHPNSLQHWNLSVSVRWRGLILGRIWFLISDNSSHIELEHVNLASGYRV